MISMVMLVSSLAAVELDWLHDFDQAMEQAKKEHKGVYLFIGADKCKFCAMFKKDTLSDKALMARLERDYVLLYLSRDRHTIPDGFQTKGAPIHYFLTSDAKVIYTSWGIIDIAGFYDLLEDAELNTED
jgi:uncharacterized protein YyaL (SSP411 family)